MLSLVAHQFVAVVAFQVPDATPSSAGLPGAEMFGNMLNWLAWFGLAGSLAALFIGGGVWGLSHVGGNAMQASKGKAFALGGAAGAIVTGLAPTIVQELSGF